MSSGLIGRWLAVVVATWLLTFAGARALAADGGPAWVGDYAEARAAARASGKPIFLVFRCER